MSSCARVCTSVRCEPTRALCMCVRLYGAIPKSFMRCEPTRALYSVLVLSRQGFVPSAYVLVRERVQMNESVPLYGASPQGLCACFYVCTVRAQKAFVRCEPTRALYSVLVLVPQGFVPSAYVLVRARVQMSSCIRSCTYVRYEPTSSMCFCVSGCADELMYGKRVCLYGASPQGLYAVCF